MLILGLVNPLFNFHGLSLDKMRHIQVQNLTTITRRQQSSYLISFGCFFFLKEKSSHFSGLREGY